MDIKCAVLLIYSVLFYKTGMLVDIAQMRSDALDCVQPLFLLAMIEMEGQKWSINGLGSCECILGDGQADPLRILW